MSVFSGEDKEVVLKKLSTFSELAMGAMWLFVAGYFMMNVFHLWYDYAVDDRYAKALHICVEQPTVVYDVKIDSGNQQVKTIEEEADRLKRQQLLLDAVAHCREQVSAHYGSAAAMAMKD